MLNGNKCSEEKASRVREQRGEGNLLDGLVKEGFSEKVIFEQRSGGNE